MTPFWFEGCFGWLHPGAQTPGEPGRGAMGRGAILCGPIGAEADYIHRAWRQLADHLAAAGVWVLRFDYRGTRDSLDHDDSTRPLRGWIESIKAADRRLREAAGVRDVALVGLRLGATLAVVAAEEMGGLDRLALLAPVASGGAYRRELAMMARLSRSGKARGADAAPAEGDADFTAEALADLAALQPCRIPVRPAPRVLVLSRAGVSGDRELVEPLRALGSEVEEAAFDGYAALMVRPDDARYPKAAFDTVVNWLSADLAPATTRSLEAPIPSKAPARTQFIDGSETAFFFRERAPLFGVAVSPSRPRAEPPAVLFLNTGAVGHSGMSGIWVGMARRFAALGLTSLRFDLAGVGDSPARDGHEDGFKRIEDAAADVTAAIDWLHGHGHERVTLVGFCRGARLAFNVAMIDKRVEGLVLINPRRLFWALEAPPQPPKGARGYLRTATDPLTWRRLMRGEIPLARVAAIPSNLMRWRQEVSAAAPGLERAPDAAARMLRSLGERGVATLWVQGQDDPYLADLEAYFSVPREAFAALFEMDTHFPRGVDHLFRRPGALAELGEAIGGHLMARWALHEPAPANDLSGSADPTPVRSGGI